MKTLFALVLAFASLNIFAAEVELVDTKTVDQHSVELNAGEKAVLVVGKEIHFNCWKNYDFRKLQSQSDIVVLRESMAHPAVVCDFPVRQIEGLRIELKNNESYTQRYNLQVPAGVSVEMESNIRPRICTAIFAVMYNPQTGACFSASNGCIVSELQAKGFEFAGNRCR